LEKDRAVHPRQEGWFFRRVLGHAVFDSMPELGRALSARLIIHTPLRRLELVSSDAPAPEKVILIPLVCREAFYMGRRDGDRQWSFRVPDGEYYVAAPKLSDGTSRSSSLTISSAQQTYAVRWTHTLPGPESLSLLAIDEAGDPV